MFCIIYLLQSYFTFIPVIDMFNMAVPNEDIITDIQRSINQIEPKFDN